MNDSHSSPKNGNAEDIDAQMRSILQSVTTIAVVGASDKPTRAAFTVMQFLQSKGYRCIPVSPRLAGHQLLGEQVYSSLAEIPLQIDMVDLFVNSELAGPVSDEAIALGVKVIWMQLGVVNQPAADRAEAAGIKVIMDHCPAQEWTRLGLPDSIVEP